MKYNEDIFTNGTFYIAPKLNYQVFITRTYIKILNNFYTVTKSFCDLISNAAEKIFPNINIRYLIWY